MPPTFTDDGQTVQHPLELKFNAAGWDILCAIEQGFRAQVDVKGKLAEWFLYKQLKELKSRGVIEDVIWHDTNGRPDFDIMIGGRTIRMECKNVRSGANPKGYQGDFRVEIQKTRNQLVGGVSLRGAIGPTISRCWLPASSTRPGPGIMSSSSPIASRGDRTFRIIW
jgi:hypothetical protein